MALTRERKDMPLTGIYQPGTSEWARIQAETFESSGGTSRGDFDGMPIVVVTTVGAKSGTLRKTALMRVEHDGAYVIVASVGGGPKNPAWYYNIRANPHVELQDVSDKADYRARELDGAERDEWWARACEAFPPYTGYQRKTERIIPIILLERMEPSPA